MEVKEKNDRFPAVFVLCKGKFNDRTRLDDDADMGYYRWQRVDQVFCRAFKSEGVMSREG